MYIYRYVDPYGKRCYVYSKDLFTLREKEQKLIRDQMDGLDTYVGGHATINMAFDRYMSTKYNLRETTRSNYIYMFNKFVRDDIIRKNPTDGVMAEIKKNSGKNKGIRHALTLEQQKAFIDAIRYSPEYVHWYPLFVTLLGTGGRIGEIIGLRWKDVDFKNRCININHAVTYYTRNGSARFGVSLPKTEAGVRSIPMMDTVYDTLKSEYERQKRDGFCVYELDGMTGFIFSNKLGSLHNPHCINLAIKRISEAYNAREIIEAKKQQREPVIIPHFSCHQLRHTFCSRLCENETNVKVIQEIMGHANVETTLDIYTEVNYSKKQESLEELSRKIDFF